MNIQEIKIKIEVDTLGKLEQVLDVIGGDVVNLRDSLISNGFSNPKVDITLDCRAIGGLKTD